MQPAQATEYHQHKERAGDVEGHHQLGQGAQRGNAVLAHGKGQRAERTDRGKAHQVAEDAEHHLRGGLQHVQHRLAMFAHGRQGKPRQHRDEQHR
ncbi:hypothetical protein D3C80_1392940 [compost metagenome]